MTNAEVARALRELALHLDMDGVAFKPRAIERVAQAIEAMERRVEEIHAREGVKGLQAGCPGCGKGIAERIAELLATGRMAELEDLRRRRPVDVLALTAIEGIGPKKVLALHEALGVRNLDDLEAAARAGRVQGLPNFKERSEEKILHAIELARGATGTRRPLGDVLPVARSIEARLARLPGVERAVVAGSVRRFRETVKDLDFLVVSERPAEVTAWFAAMAEVAEVYAHGENKALVRLAGGLDADLRVVPRRSFGAALNYFTGSKAHNIALRRIAMERGLKLSEWGLYRDDEPVAGETEEGIYRALGLGYVPPELREDEGEIEAARDGTLPELVPPGALRGDLQTQTDWTDGKASLEAMVEAARALGLEYVAITDHTRDLAMTGGSDEAKLMRQMEAIAALNAKRPGIRVLAGAEVNIRRDGTLDIDDATLARLDVVGAAVHSLFGLPREEQTARLVRAVEHPHVDILFHPTARRLGRREPIDADWDVVIDAAVRAGTLLELDAHPERLDLRSELVRRALARGARIVLDSDAHHTSELRFPEEFGIGTARRGWARAADVVNTLPVDGFLAALKGGMPARGGGTRRPRRKRTG